MVATIRKVGVRGVASGSSATEGIVGVELDRFRRALLARRREVIGDVDQLRTGESPGDELLRHEQELLVEIDNALQKIEAGTFGICEATGRPISRARLQVMPWARHCIDCVRAREQH